MNRNWRFLMTSALIAGAYAVAAADEPEWDALPYTAHAAYQAVDADGNGTFLPSDPIRMRGIVLNRADLMLDGTPSAPAFLGGAWQICIQTIEPTDFGGTALYMAQLYGNLPFIPPEIVYTDQQWLDELARLEYDPTTGTKIKPGDLIEVRARVPGLFYGGKTNINEAHSTDPAADFDIVLLAADCGLPEPTLIALADVKDASDEFIFDSTRATGCEHYQATLVRINDVSFVDTAGWGPNATLAIQDGTGRTFPVKLGRSEGFMDYPAPTGLFDIIALFDQEDTNSDGDGMEGYRLWVVGDYDGNGAIIPGMPTLPGDMNRDTFVDLDDVPLFIQALLERSLCESSYPACDIAAANCDGECGIDGRDVAAFVELLIN